LSLRTTAHPFHTIFAQIIGTSLSETTMRRNPRSAKERLLRLEKGLEAALEELGVGVSVQDDAAVTTERSLGLRARMDELVEYQYRSEMDLAADRLEFSAKAQRQAATLSTGIGPGQSGAV
jgi:ATPase subunit of ABC transporter with duplicated ATPase domains